MKRIARDLLNGVTTYGYLEDVDPERVEEVFGKPQGAKTWYIEFANGKRAKVFYHRENLHVGGFDDSVLEDVQKAIMDDDECAMSDLEDEAEVVGSTVVNTDPDIMFRDDTFKYIMTLDAIRRKYNQRPSWIRITTITMMFKNGESTRFDSDTIRDAFANGPIRIRRKGALFDGHEWSIRESTFYNQVTVGYTDKYSTKSVKIFPNGTVHVTGCSDLYDCHRVSKQLAHLLTTIFKLEEPLTSDAFNVLMINTNFSMNKPVNQMDIIEHLGRNPMFKVSFKPERYSAVKIKFKPRPDMKQVTASVFSTGKVIVTGARALKEIVFAYDTLNAELEAFTYSPDTFLTLYNELKTDCSPTRYNDMRDATIEAMSYYTPKLIDDLDTLEDQIEGPVTQDNMYQLMEHAERLAVNITKKQLDSFDTVFGSKFSEWVNMLAQRGVTPWV